MSVTDSNKSILLIALETPPARSAGVQRPFRFAEYLLELGWDPIILTATTNIYQRFDYDLQVPSALAQRTYRAQAYDSNQLFSIAGRSTRWLAAPDRYWPWYFDAVRLGNRLIKDHNIGAIWSTYPVITAHLVARKLANQHHLPWIADFRDPLQCHYHHSHRHFNPLNRYLERKIVERADQVCLTSDSAANLYRQLYPAQPNTKFAVIENGFVPLVLPAATVTDKFTLLYSGALYGNGRDIQGIFRVLAQLKQQHKITANNFVLRFRGSAKPEQYAKELQQLDLQDLVEFLPAVPFTQAQAEMLHCTANLLIQDDIFKYQIPGKIYDYVQSQKPILAICPEQSATAQVCAKLPNCWRVWQDTELYQALTEMLQQKWQPALSSTEAEQYSRRSRTKQLAALLTNLT